MALNQLEAFAVETLVVNEEGRLGSRPRGDPGHGRSGGIHAQISGRLVLIAPCVEQRPDGRNVLVTAANIALAVLKCYGRGWDNTNGAQTGYPTRRIAWHTAFILMLCYTLSYADRQILVFLVGPLKHDLQISDTQVGLP